MLLTNIPRKSDILDFVDFDIYCPTLHQKVYKNLKQTKDLILYEPEQNISHTNITKYAQDTYKDSADYYNRFTDQLEARMDSFLQKLTP